jgi:pyridoxamine 5'-phosphate oxidase
MDDPIRAVAEERARARQAGDPLVDVCYLATVAAPNRAEVRALSLRDINERGFSVLVNRTSPKWVQLSSAGRATLLIHWPLIGRQYRIWGGIAPMELERVRHYWDLKRHESRLLEHYYTAFRPQSDPISSHEHLLEGVEVLRRRYPRQESVPIPESLEGIYVVPDEIEVWHSSPNRLHQRRRYRRSPSGWQVEHLVP